MMKIAARAESSVKLLQFQERSVEDWDWESGPGGEEGGDAGQKKYGYTQLGLTPDEIYRISDMEETEN